LNENKINNLLVIYLFDNKKLDILNILLLFLISLISITFINNWSLVFAEKPIENSQSNWTKYTNQTYGFTLEYPSSWIVKDYQQEDKKNEIFDLQIGQLTRNILDKNFTGFFAFKSFGESSFGKMPIDDMNFITEIVKNTVEKIITNNYNLNLTIINNTQTHKLINTGEEIGTFAFLGDKDKKNIMIISFVANHKGNTTAFFILGTLNQFENPKLVEIVTRILKSITWIESDSNNNEDLGQPNNKLETTNPILNILESATIMGNPNYEPKELVVNKDSTIIVNNTDTMPHTVTYGEGGSDPNSGKIFDTNIINGGDSAEIDTSNVDIGKYPYYCMVHPYMTGTLIIQ
jgi:plastocyanin